MPQELNLGCGAFWPCLGIGKVPWKCSSALPVARMKLTARGELCSLPRRVLISNDTALRGGTPAAAVPAAMMI